MAEQKVNRDNHPLLSEARQKGYAEGLKEGWEKGYAAKCNEIHDHYKSILQVFMCRLDAANEEVRRLRGGDTNGRG